MSYRKLNAAQRLVVDAYVDGAVSMADAVIEAGHVHGEGETPFDVAERLLASPKIQKAIAERSAIVNDRGVASALWLVRKLVDYAQVDPTDIYDRRQPGRVLPPHEWPPALRRMVRKIKTDEIGNVQEVGFESKVKILELLGRTDLIGAFSGENEANETIIVVRDMTRKIEQTAEQTLALELEVKSSVSEN